MSNLRSYQVDAIERAKQFIEILNDAIPRAQAILPELKLESQTRNVVLEFIAQAEESFLTETENERLSLETVRDYIYPIIIRWEGILQKRKDEAKTSNFVGQIGEAKFFEATVVFWKSFEGDFGTRFLTMLKDDCGNALKYWNNFNIIDPIEAQANGTDGKRVARKGDKIKFKATIKDHDIYKDVKSTVLSRARKAELISAGELE